MARAGRLRLPQAVHAALAMAVLALLTLLLHGHALSMGWRFDDPAHLRFIGSYAPWQYFFVPDVMREQSYAHITPWNALFYAIGLKLFGLDARGHYAHLLAVIWLTACVTWGMLRRRIGEGAAFAAAALFLAMPPTGAMAQLLMTGHYAYGLLWTVLALWYWSRAVREGRMRHAWATAFFYALACLCKELYVPLPVVLLFWPALNWRLRARLLAPATVVAFAYSAFRLWLLGGVGGYAKLADAPVLGWSELLAGLIRMTEGVVHMALGAGTGGWIAFALVVACLLIGIWQGWRPPLAMAGVAVLALLLPIAPVLLAISQEGIAGRFLVLVAWALSVMLALSSRYVGWRWGAGLMSALLLVLGLNQHKQGVLIESASRSGQFENHFMLYGDPASHLIPLDYTHTGYVHSMGEARTLILGEAAPTVVQDDEQLAKLGTQAGRATWAWVPVCSCLRPLGDTWDARAQVFERGVARGQALASSMAIEIRLKDEGRFKRLTWHVQGPAGRVMLEVPELGNFGVERRGQAPFGTDATLKLKDTVGVRAVIEMPDGALIRSPLLVLPTQGEHGVSWSGKN